jgi:hypothetical protein
MTGKEARSMFVQHKREFWYITSVFILCSALWGGVQGVIAADARYLKVEHYQTDRVLDRIKLIQDKLFVINFKIREGSAGALDYALKEKYQNELTNINAKLKSRK